jgi:sugar/nucleoside kinase (ribokinase family)
VDLLGIGTAVVDYFIKVDDRFLEHHRLIKGATNFRSRKDLDELFLETAEATLLRLPGDNARNVCEGIVRLGGLAAYAGSTGKDDDGRFLERALKSLGIRSLLAEKPGKTGRILIYITPDGERTFAVDLGNGLDFSKIPKAEVAGSKYLYLTSITILAAGPIARTSMQAVRIAKRTNTCIAFSLESPPMIRRNNKRLIELIEGIDVLFANEEEAAALGLPPSQISKKVKYLYLKRGVKGSSVFWDRKKFEIPKYSKRTVDTTGAGDYYAAGVLSALCRGLDAEEAGREGARLAAEIVERLGASFYRENAPKEKQPID